MNITINYRCGNRNESDYYLPDTTCTLTEVKTKSLTKLIFTTHQIERVKKFRTYNSCIAVYCSLTIR